MNKNIDLTKILKDCPKGTELYSLVYGEVELQQVEPRLTYPIVIKLENGNIERLTSNGKLFELCNGECVLFPYKDKRDWYKFTTPWCKKEKFNPKTLKTFDKVLVMRAFWQIEFFSHIWRDRLEDYKYQCSSGSYKICITYNDNTKHLIGTTVEAPEYYRYWEE